MKPFGPIVIFRTGDYVLVPGERRSEIVEHVIVRGFRLYLKLHNRREPVSAEGVGKVCNPTGYPGSYYS